MSLQKEHVHIISRVGQEEDLDLFIPVLSLTHMVIFLLLQVIS